MNVAAVTSLPAGHITHGTDCHSGAAGGVYQSHIHYVASLLGKQPALNRGCDNSLGWQLAEMESP